MNIEVTATVTFHYDTADGVVENEDQALDDVEDMIDSGDLSSYQFTFDVKVRD